MNYLRDKRLSVARRKKGAGAVIIAVFFILLLAVFRGPIFAFFSAALNRVGRPIWSSSGAAAQDVSALSGSLRSKQSILDENQGLQDQILEETASVADREVLLEENSQLKEILGRKASPNMVLAAILAKPNKSIYDTMIVDVGEDLGISKGARVFAYGDELLGTVSEVYADTSLVDLYSTPGEKTDVVLGAGNSYVQATGRGGQNFEITVPADQVIEPGTAVVLPGITPYVLADVTSVISDPRDPFQKILLTSPVNIQDLKFVEIEK